MNRETNGKGTVNQLEKTVLQFLSDCNTIMKSAIATCPVQVILEAVANFATVK